MQTGRPGQPWVVYSQTEQLYTVRNLEPTLTSIENDVDVLVVVHPKNLPPAALYAIDQFALRGGRVLVFVDPDAQADQSAADPNNPMAQFMADKSSHFEPLLAAWGVDFKSRPGGRRPGARHGGQHAPGRAAAAAHRGAGSRRRPAWRRTWSPRSSTAST